MLMDRTVALETALRAWLRDSAFAQRGVLGVADRRRLGGARTARRCAVTVVVASAVDVGDMGRVFRRASAM